jgi:hypothetical protein
MRRVFVLSVTVAGLCVGMVSAAVAAQQKSCTEDGVRAVEAQWTHAFLTGDEAYLNGLLDDDYVSVNQKGVARPKAAIIALAKKIAAMPNPPASTKPPLNISVHGNAAIVTSSSPADASVDVFHCDDGAWHAWYSQHTPVSAPAK